MNTIHARQGMQLKQNNNGDKYISIGKDMVMIVAVTNQTDILFIEEESIAYQIPVVTLPTGTIENNELPDITADRNLQTQLGCQAEQLTYIGTLHPSIKNIQWQCHLYLAQYLIRGDAESNNTVSSASGIVRAIPINEFKNWVHSKQISDATTIAAISMIRQYLRFD